MTNNVSPLSAVATRQPKGLRIIPASSVEAQEVDWLWPPYTPFGKVTLIEGDPGVGKSFLLLKLASDLSRGKALPGCKPGEPVKSLFFVVEDGFEDTIRPRLDKLGADLDRILLHDYRCPSVEEELKTWLTLTPDGVAAISTAIEREQPGLVVLDPFSAFVPKGMNPNSATHVRLLLTRLARIAEHYGCAIIVLRHLNKDSKESKALYRGAGSIEYAAACRSMLTAGVNPDNRDEFVLTHSKHNLTKRGTSLRYAVTDDGLFEWRGESDLSANEVLASESPDDGLYGSEISFLREMLVDGPKLAGEIYQAGKERGYEEHRLRRAFGKLGGHNEAQHDEQGRFSAWVWSLDGHPAT